MVICPILKFPCIRKKCALWRRFHKKEFIGSSEKGDCYDLIEFFDCALITRKITEIDE
jgi:hypothetical protein